jgi:hypothetical protein
MTKLKQDYTLCASCNYLLLTAVYFNGSTICDICLKNKGAI